MGAHPHADLALPDGRSRSILFFTVGVNQGIDFKGGTVIEVESHADAADLAGIRTKVEGLGLGEVQVQGIGDAKTVLIRVAAQPGGEQAQQAVVDKVKGALGSTDYEYRRVEVVGPRVSGELARSGTLAVLLTIAGIMVYIWFRFEWQFAHRLRRDARPRRDPDGRFLRR